MRIRATIWLFAVWALASQAPALSPNEPWNVEYVSQIGGVCDTVRVAGNYACIGEGSSLTILDIANPLAPVRVGGVNFGDFHITQIRLHEGFAYVTGTGALRIESSGLRIVDIRNPRLPVLRGVYHTPNYASGVYVSGKYAYVTCGFFAALGPTTGSLEIVDVSNVSSPVLRGYYEHEIFANEVFVNGPVAYVGARDGMAIVDVTDPNAPQRLSQYNTANVIDIITSGAIAYVKSGSSLEIIDISNLSNPVRLSQILAFGNSGLCLSGTTAYVGRGNYRDDGLQTIDVSDPTSPTYVGFCRTPGWARAVDVSGGTACMAVNDGGLAIVDVSNPTSPTYRASYDTLSDPRDMVMENGIAYVANGIMGMKVFDMSRPESPRLLGALAMPGPADRITLAGKRAYINEGISPSVGVSLYLYPFIHIVDIADPSSPKLLGSYRASWPRQIAVSGNLAYATDRNLGLLVLDVTDPTSPTLRGRYPDLHDPDGLAVSGTKVFIADYDRLAIIEARNPDSPFLWSAYSESNFDSIRNVFLSGGNAYITGSLNGAELACIDVTNPSLPRRKGMFDGPDPYAADVFVSDGYAYLSTDGRAPFPSGAFNVIDIRNPALPTLAGFYPSYFQTFSFRIFASDDLAYLSDNLGLRILRFKRPPAGAGHWRLYR